MQKFVPVWFHHLRKVPEGPLLFLEAIRKPGRQAVSSRLTSEQFGSWLLSGGTGCLWFLKMNQLWDAPPNTGVNEVFELNKIHICTCEYEGNCSWSDSTEPLISYFPVISRLDPAGRPCRGAQTERVLVFQALASKTLFTVQLHFSLLYSVLPTK